MSDFNDFPTSYAGNIVHLRPVVSDEVKRKWNVEVGQSLRLFCNAMFENYTIDTQHLCLVALLAREVAERIARNPSHKGGHNDVAASVKVFTKMLHAFHANYTTHLNT